jgi:hypothetical protein
MLPQINESSDNFMQRVFHQRKKDMFIAIGEKDKI